MAQIGSIRMRQNNVIKKKKEFVVVRGEKLEVKGENAGYQHFLLSPLCFQKAL